jgi:predicted SAM-dependent methyltransferase
MNLYGIKYVNLGGYRPAVGYLNIQLSPVELYGLPSICHNTISLSYDETTAEISQTAVPLDSPGLSLHYDITNGLPLESCSVTGINMSHILEHFTRDEGLAVLRECLRVLREEGVLRVSCPDLKKYAEAYINRDDNFYHSIGIQKACCYEGLTTYGDLFISKAYDNHNGHKWFYDAESTIQLLKEAGFNEAKEKQLHDSVLPELEFVEPAFRAIESFYVEAIK